MQVENTAASNPFFGANAEGCPPRLEQLSQCKSWRNAERTTHRRCLASEHFENTLQRSLFSHIESSALDLKRGELRLVRAPTRCAVQKARLNRRSKPRERAPNRI
jgi:hypothetical protein